MYLSEVPRVAVNFLGSLQALSTIHFPFTTMHLTLKNDAQVAGNCMAVEIY